MSTKPSSSVSALPSLSIDDLATANGGIDWKSVGQSAKFGAKVGATTGAVVGLGTIAFLGPIGIPTAVGVTAAYTGAGAASAAATDLAHQFASNALRSRAR